MTNLSESEDLAGRWQGQTAYKNPSPAVREVLLVKNLSVHLRVT